MGGVGRRDGRDPAALLMTPALLCMAFVVGVVDGDTLRVRCDSPNLGESKVRLAEIDAPEKGQPYGQRAKQALSDLVFGKVVKVIEVDRDRYGRVVARIEPVGGPEVNFEMVRLGLAWCYPQYVIRREQCEAAEKSARSAPQGVWLDAQPQAPWEWRRARR